MMLALLTVLLATTGTPTCSEPPQAFIDVVGTHGPVSVETDFGLADLHKLAADSGRPIHHPPLGFYYGQFSYILKIAIGASAATVCNDPVHITVVMGLTNRRIEIGRELVRTLCYADVLAHYERHAAQDDTILSHYITSVLRALNATPLPPFERDMETAKNRSRIEHFVQAVVDRSLDSLTKEREAARDTVDTADEVRHLNEACSNQT